MFIKTYLEYFKCLDIVEGYEDIGQKGRTEKFTSHLLVFIARGLYAKWKLLLALLLSASSTRCDVLRNLLLCH